MLNINGWCLVVKSLGIFYSKALFYVAEGIIKSGANARVIRDGVIVYDGKIASVQREKDTVKEVKKGFECGITLENFSDIKEGDIIENYEMVEIKR